MELIKIDNPRAHTDRKLPSVCINKAVGAYFNATAAKLMKLQPGVKISLYFDSANNDWYLAHDPDGTPIRKNDYCFKIGNSFFKTLLDKEGKAACKRISFYLAPEPCRIMDKEIFYINTKLPFNELY